MSSETNPGMFAADDELSVEELEAVDGGATDVNVCPNKMQCQCTTEPAKTSASIE